MKDHPMYKEPPEGVWEFLDIVVLLHKQAEYARLRRRKSRKSKTATAVDKAHHVGLARQAKRKWRKHV